MVLVRLLLGCCWLLLLAGYRRVPAPRGLRRRGALLVERRERGAKTRRTLNIRRAERKKSCRVRSLRGTSYLDHHHRAKRRSKMKCVRAWPLCAKIRHSAHRTINLDTTWGAHRHRCVRYAGAAVDPFTDLLRTGETGKMVFEFTITEAVYKGTSPTTPEHRNRTNTERAESFLEIPLPPK